MEEQKIHYTQRLESASKAFEAERKSWLAKLESATAGKIESQQEIERLSVEKERLVRQVKRVKASILLCASASSRSACDGNGMESAEQAREDFIALDSDIRVHSKREAFEKRAGQRCGKVKYRDWLEGEESISLDKDNNLNN